MDIIEHICLLGATGSIGQSTQKILRQYPENFKLYSLAIHSNDKEALKLIKEFNVQQVCVWDLEAFKSLKKETSIPVLFGLEGLLELVSNSKVSYVLNALVGSVGCLPTLKAIENHKKIGLANKETMVMAGEIIQDALKKYPKSKIIPIDSEHSAIFQCLQNRPLNEVESIQLTASGGPFRTIPIENMPTITIEQALKHPTWSMGNKITIDSATMMNKGLEVIETHYLFNIDYSQIKILVHPTSTVHSLVQFQDGSLLSQLGCTDMQIPILFALTQPQRFSLKVDMLDLTQIGKLEFFPADFEKFPCIELAYKAGQNKGCQPAILNASNEIAVSDFLNRKISFTEIPKRIEACLKVSSFSKKPSLDEILEADQWARQYHS